MGRAPRHSEDWKVHVALGASLAALRGAENQKPFAERVGMSQPQLSRLETGHRRCTVAELLALATALQVDPRKWIAVVSEAAAADDPRVAAKRLVREGRVPTELAI